MRVIEAIRRVSQIFATSSGVAAPFGMAAERWANRFHDIKPRLRLASLSQISTVRL